MASPNPPSFDLSKLGFDVSKMRLTPGRDPFAETREEAIADSTERIAEFQKAHPNVDVKAAIVEPTVNFYYDMKEKLDPETYNKHQDLMKKMMNHLMPPGHSYPFKYPSPSERTSETGATTGDVATNPPPSDDSDPTKSQRDSKTNNRSEETEHPNETDDNKESDEPTDNNDEKLAFAQTTFWKARDVLRGNEEDLTLFDSVYLQPERPAEVMLEQLQKCFAHMPQVYAALAAGGEVKENGGTGEENSETAVAGDALVGLDGEK